MMNLDDARRRLADRVEALPSVNMKLMEAIGCRLAESPHADTDVPTTDVSTMDGYAVRAADVASNATLPISFEVPAGTGRKLLPEGYAARIFTGAVMPAGADTVIPQEQAERRADGTVLLTALNKGSYIRRQAELCANGASLGKPGDPITPQLVALLGVAGASTVRVTPRPRVAILSTGSELVPIDQHPAPGQIRDSNGPMLAALARVRGFDVTLVSRVGDEIRALGDAIDRASHEADLVVTGGGVSVGDYDLVPDALRDLGAETVFHKLSIKPGKPILMARLGRSWVAGLPGNPVSALVGWRLFARPLGEALGGDLHAFFDPPETAVLTEPARNTGDRTLLAPAVMQSGDCTTSATVLPLKGSHDVVAVARANALVIVGIGEEYGAGDRVRCYRLD